MLNNARSITINNPWLLAATRVSRRFYSSRGSNDATEEEIQSARKWLANLDADTIRQNAPCEVTFSRSSGPGGQNVNKVSSKATLRVPTASLLSLLPQLLHQNILSSRYHASKSGDVVIQADDSRKQTDNVNACFRKLHDLIVQAGRDAVPGETSAEQSKRVEQLKKAEAATRRKHKEYQSKKKSARRDGGRGD
ncbi:peptidyl-tRNA hydrolase domain-containing protein [Neohortaea acidophila]|uniref:Peptidyl-tRNA hydrolase domain-containing protein n=1 Tax=Neohortaea acidophila TaxID=245834 RepID=A0A6A6PQS2_9PEZI|nr:peptidyl-tRNA hydrolase domain-containing protein [Neohortaea acidophila]KAF2481793.1 peptidyl-tRNA hydrolase domain-containing protein [Neohortaea acidophila]